jgi:hypothetical protein
MGSSCYTCDKEYSSKNNLQRYHYEKQPDHAPPDWTKCQECGRMYESISHHWGRNPSHEPDLSEHQHEVLTGVLMGDGHIKINGKNGHLTVNIIKRPYLEYLDEVFSGLSNGVQLERTAEESFEQSGGMFRTSVENFNDIYQFRTKAHKEITPYREWYSSGKKVWPDDIEMTPTVLKHWYCCDGSYNTSGGHRSIRIGMKNEKNNKEKVDSYFSERGLPTPYYNEPDTKINGCTAEWGNLDSDELFEYMGEPIDGFKYKWPK